METEALPVTGGRALVAYRETCGMSRLDLSKLLEVSRMTVWRWEEADRLIEIEVLPRVVERTGIPARVLRPDLAELMAETSEAAE